jgi:hypothetical protein
MGKTLTSVGEWNRYIVETYNLNNIYPRLNGLSCPNCSKELYDSDSSILTSYPPQKNIHCDCGYKGYRVC